MILMVILWKFFDINLKIDRRLMTMAELKPGSVRYTVPEQTHDRRIEVYFCFDIAIDQTICHYMGQLKETRHICIPASKASYFINGQIIYVDGGILASIGKPKES
jgi:5-keto 4-deoxyuronate isomerase